MASARRVLGAAETRADKPPVAQEARWVSKTRPTLQARPGGKAPIMIRLGLLSELRGGDAGLDPYTEPIRRVEQPLRERGVALVRRDPDLVLADAGRVEDVDASCPVIAYERADGGMLWWDFEPHGGRARRVLKSRRVVGLLQLTRYAHLACYNRPCAEDAYHIQRIYEAADGALPRLAPPSPIALGESDLRKIEVGYGFWAFRCCDPLPDYEIDGDGGK